MSKEMDDLQPSNLLAMKNMISFIIYVKLATYEDIQQDHSL